MGGTVDRVPDSCPSEPGSNPVFCITKSEKKIIWDQPRARILTLHELEHSAAVCQHHQVEERPPAGGAGRLKPDDPDQGRRNDDSLSCQCCHRDGMDRLFRDQEPEEVRLVSHADDDFKDCNKLDKSDLRLRFDLKDLKIWGLMTQEP